MATQRQKKKKAETPPVVLPKDTELVNPNPAEPFGDPTTFGWKLAKVLGEIHTIPKEGTNEHYGYKYVLEDTLTNQIRPIMAKWGISLVFGAEKVEDLAGGYDVEGKGQGYWTRVWCRFTLFDCDGHEFSVLCPGEGTDSHHPDKALYKAMTGATKYFLYKTFLVSTGDEPERDDSPDTTIKKTKKQSGKGKTQPTQDSDSPDMITAAQKKELEGFVGTEGFTDQLNKILGEIVNRGGSEGSAKRILAECKKQAKPKTNSEDQKPPESEEELTEEDIPF